MVDTSSPDELSSIAGKAGCDHNRTNSHTFSNIEPPHEQALLSIAELISRRTAVHTRQEQDREVRARMIEAIAVLDLLTACQSALPKCSRDRKAILRGNDRAVARYQIKEMPPHSAVPELPVEYVDLLIDRIVEVRSALHEAYGNTKSPPRPGPARHLSQNAEDIAKWNHAVQWLYQKGNNHGELHIVTEQMTPVEPILARAVDFKQPATKAPPTRTQQAEGEKPAAADPHANLRDFARSDLKGQERAVIEALCDAGGEKSIADVAVVNGVGWDDVNKGFESVQRRLNPKLKRQGWTLARQNNAARLKNNARLVTRQRPAK